MSLDEAIDRVQKVYDRDRLHASPTDVVAQHLGYKGASNGAALSALASVRYFGLFERPRDGFLAVTKDFEHYKFAPEEVQRKRLLIGFLRKPSLYAELLDKYEGGLPSDANLRFELIQRGFSPVSAEVALAAFRRSVEYADYFADDSPVIEALAGPAEENEEMVIASSHGPKPIPSSSTLISSPRVELSTSNFGSDEGMDHIPVRLPGGRRAWLVIPTPLFNSDKDRLKAQIDLLLTQDEDQKL
jgi:hypothetical protein